MANPDQYSLERVWHVIEEVGTCMMTTRFEGGLRARPSGSAARQRRKCHLVSY